MLLADEPTGNLDRTTGEQIMQILRELNRREKLTIVMVTHDPWIAEQADRTVSSSKAASSGLSGREPQTDCRSGAVSAFLTPFLHILHP